MEQQEPFGQLSLIDEKLFLDGAPITDGQLLFVKLGKGEPTLGRAKIHPKGGWYLDREEFIGHTYLNIRLTKNGSMA